MRKWILFGKNIKSKEFFRFLIIGSINSVVSYAIYFLFLNFGFNHWAANFAALFFGIFWSFRLGGIVVFRNPDSQLWKKFFMAWIFIYIVISILIGLFLKYGVSAQISGLLALPFSAALSFFIQKNFVFGR